MGLRNFRKTKITGKRKPTEQQQTDRQTHSRAQTRTQWTSRRIHLHLQSGPYNIQLHNPLSLCLSLSLSAAFSECVLEFVLSRLDLNKWRGSRTNVAHFFIYELAVSVCVCVLTTKRPLTISAAHTESIENDITEYRVRVAQANCFSFRFFCRIELIRRQMKNRPRLGECAECSV